MIVDDLQKQIDELGSLYWEGKQNFFIRYWTYLDRGLEMFNKFKYYIGFPLAAGALIPFLADKLGWLVSLTIVGLPILIIAGRYDMHKISKTRAYVSTIMGDIFQFKPIQLTIEQVNLLKEIRDELKKRNG